MRLWVLTVILLDDCRNSLSFSAVARKGFAGCGVTSLLRSLTGPGRQRGKRSGAGWLGRCRGCAGSSGQLEISSGPLAESEVLPASSGSLCEHGRTAILGYFVQLSTDWHWHGQRQLSNHNGFCLFFLWIPEGIQIKYSELYFSFFFTGYQNCQKWLVCSQKLSNQTLRKQSLRILSKMIDIC